jgi:hypothetical protein
MGFSTEAVSLDLLDPAVYSGSAIADVSAESHVGHAVLSGLVVDPRFGDVEHRGDFVGGQQPV